MSAHLEAANKERLDRALIPYRGRTLDRTKEVRIHRNLRNTPARWTIIQRGMVVAHADAIMMRSCRLIVSAAGAARAERIGKRVVCAYAVGTLTGSGMGIEADTERPLPAIINYEPKARAFVCRNLTTQPNQITGALVLHFRAKMSGAYTTSNNLTHRSCHRGR